MRRAMLMLILLLAATAASGCSLFRQDLPSDSCEDDFDCFRAQGEMCNPATKMCEVPADAAPIPDARPRPDADTTDADTTDADTTPDADIPDAGLPDA